MIDKIMIVAQHDEEEICGGAELLSQPKGYKVEGVDEYHNEVRKKEFISCMKYIGIKEYEHWTGYKGGED